MAALPKRGARTISAFVAGMAFACTGLPFLTRALPQDEKPAQDKKQGAEAAMQDAMQRAAKIRAPGPRHALLARFLGEWDYTLTITGFAKTEGKASFSWLIDGRWLHAKSSGTMLGEATESHAILGYDNFKKSYVTTFVSSMDTAMLHSEGDLDRSGKTLTTYGRMDEYLTGEHDKMVRYVWRFVSDDEIRFEVHDLGIGEPNTKVLDYVYKRRAEDAGEAAPRADKKESAAEGSDKSPATRSRRK